MRSLNAPTLGISDVLDKSGTGGKIATVLPYRDNLVRAEHEYKNALDVPDVDSLPNRMPGVPEVIHDAIAWAYKAKIVDGSARDVYEVVRALAGGRCPLCLVRDTQHLDHYLPKEHYPNFALHPVNLVPICSLCNHTKSSKTAAGVNDQYLHPYFDDLGSDVWLKAELVESPLAPLRYYVEPGPGWSQTLVARVGEHFARFGLATLFAGEGATLLSSISYRLSRATPQDRRLLLLEDAESYRRGGKQPWLAAAHEAWGRSDWFCNGGWLLP